MLPLSFSSKREEIAKLKPLMAIYTFLREGGSNFRHRIEGNAIWSETTIIYRIFQLKIRPRLMKPIFISEEGAVRQYHRIKTYLDGDYFIFIIKDDPQAMYPKILKSKASQ